MLLQAPAASMARSWLAGPGSLAIHKSFPDSNHSLPCCCGSLPSVQGVAEQEEDHKEGKRAVDEQRLLLAGHAVGAQAVALAGWVGVGGGGGVSECGVRCWQRLAERPPAHRTMSLGRGPPRCTTIVQAVQIAFRNWHSKSPSIHTPPYLVLRKARHRLCPRLKQAPLRTAHRALPVLRQVLRAGGRAQGGCSLGASSTSAAGKPSGATAHS